MVVSTISDDWPEILETACSGPSQSRAEILPEAWKQGQLMTAPEAHVAFGQLDSEFRAWNATIQAMRIKWGALLRSGRIPVKGDWIAIYPDNLTALPTLVCKTSEDFEPRTGPGYYDVPLTVQTYSVLE